MLDDDRNYDKIKLIYLEIDDQVKNRTSDLENTHIKYDNKYHGDSIRIEDLSIVLKDCNKAKGEKMLVKVKTARN